MPCAISLTGSVQVYRENVEQAREDHHHEEWHVDDMPEREQPLEGIEAGHLTHLAEVFLQIAADRCLKALCVLANNGGARLLLLHSLARPPHQTPVTAPGLPHDAQVANDAADNAGRWRKHAPVDSRQFLANGPHQGTHMAAAD